MNMQAVERINQEMQTLTAQGQASINKMTDCIRKMEEAGDRDGAGKLRNALSALLTTTLGILQ